jgi:sugar lactone lactonase YvrE
MVALSRDGRMAYTANIGSGSVTAFDLGARRAVKTVTTGKGPEAIDVSPDGRELWAADRTLNYIRVLDARTLDSLATMPTGAFPNRLKFTPDGRLVVVSNAAASTVSFYDAKTRALVSVVPLPLDRAKATAAHLASELGASALPLGVLMAPDGARAWVAAAAVNELLEFDLRTRTVTRTLRTGATPDGMAFVR